MKTIGLALGGGGARGLAHIPLLEVFDELGIRPHRIAGTSIGAIIGALYASGKSGKDIRGLVDRMIVTKGHTFREALNRKDALRLLKLLDVDFGHGGLFKGDKFIQFLYDDLGASTFEELHIPFCVAATDFWNSSQVVFCSGSLLTAVRASMGLPGVFTPVERDGRILIDGGAVNPVPYDLLDDCEATVAIDVMGVMRQGPRAIPTLYRAVLGTFDIMQKSIVAEKLRRKPPDVYVKPNVEDVDLLEFYKADEIYEQVRPDCERLKRELGRLAAG